MEGITNIFGSNLTNAILQTSNATNFMCINEYQFFELIDATIVGSNRPSTSTIHNQCQDILSTAFNFQQKVVANDK